jgi:hypothetical protein
MQRRVGVVADPEKEHLPVQIVHTAHRALGDVGRERERTGGDLLRPRTGRRKRKRVVAPRYPRSGDAGVVIGSKSSSSPVQAGITSVP